MAKGSSKVLKTNVNLPIVFALSIIPDIDLIIPVLQHRGPTHSVILAFAVFVPFLIVYRKKAVPYMLALVSHALIGDYITGKVQLLWPLSTEYGLAINIRSTANVALEWALFVLAIAIMLRARDMASLLQPRNSNLILAIPTFTALLPIVLSYPLGVPVWLVPPHIAYILVFSASMIITLVNMLKTHVIFRGTYARKEGATRGHESASNFVSFAERNVDFKKHIQLQSDESVELSAGFLRCQTRQVGSRIAIWA